MMDCRAGQLLLLIVVALVTVSAASADLNAAGMAAYARGDYASAERLFRQAIAQSPDDPLLHYHRGVALTKLHRWHEASEAYARVLRLRPSPAIAAATRDALRSLAPLTAAPPPRPAEPDPAPPAEAAPPPIALRRFGGNWVTDVVLNDTTTATFLVDTGASICVITPELAASLGIQPGDDSRVMRLQTISGGTAGAVANIEVLRVGQVEARDVGAVIHPLEGMDGILGNSFLSRYTVTLDPDRGVLDLRIR
jgi:clan AA aspartic protease (TIGR02281 family)